jgi:hypothetical protein
VRYAVSHHKKTAFLKLNDLLTNLQILIKVQELIAIIINKFFVNFLSGLEAENQLF